MEEFPTSKLVEPFRLIRSMGATAGVRVEGA